jgi:hypothetical protein
MEDRLKEQMMLFADRTSTSWLRSNQIRLYCSTVAYQLMQALRRLGLAGTELAQAQCHTVRLKLLKIGADSYHRAQNLGIDVDRLLVPGSVPPGVSEFRSHPAALKILLEEAANEVGASDLLFLRNAKFEHVNAVKRLRVSTE